MSSPANRHQPNILKQPGLIGSADLGLDGVTEDDPCPQREPLGPHQEPSPPQAMCDAS